MPDFLDDLASGARETIEQGYYEEALKVNAPTLSLREAILKCKSASVISEVKFASPSMGAIKRERDLKRIVRDMEEGGAIGISILTEPKHFKGHINFIAKVRGLVSTPILMKDIILSPIQIDAASKVGANAILLIKALFERGYCEVSLHEMIGYAHSKGLEVLLEAHTQDGFLSALKTEADIVGINNRDLSSLKVDLEVTEKILVRHSDFGGKVIVSESGIKEPKDIRRLHKYGVHGFLVGTAIMKAKDIKGKVKELVEAL